MSVFTKPVGYKYQKNPVEGPVLVRNEPIASIIQEALEGYASGRFQLQVEVVRFLESFPEVLGKSTHVPKSLVKVLLTRSVYAGLVESQWWGVSLRQGRQEPLISYGTFLKIQERLAAIAIPRSIIRSVRISRYAARFAAVTATIN